MRKATTNKHEWTRMGLVLAALVCLCLTLSACTVFEASVYREDGTVIRTVRETGAPLLSRKATFSIRHEWLDGENVLHEESIVRGVDENASAQLEMVRLMRELAEMAAAGGS